MGVRKRVINFVVVHLPTLIQSDWPDKVDVLARCCTRALLKYRTVPLIISPRVSMPLRFPSLALALALFGCAGQESPAPHCPDAPARSAPVESVPAASDDPPEALGAANDSVLVGDPPILVAGPLSQLPGDWTVRATDVSSAREGAATLRAFRTG